MAGQGSINTYTNQSKSPIEAIAQALQAVQTLRGFKTDDLRNELLQGQLKQQQSAIPVEEAKNSLMSKAWQSEMDRQNNPAPQAEGDPADPAAAQEAAPKSGSSFRPPELIANEEAQTKLANAKDEIPRKNVAGFNEAAKEPLTDFQGAQTIHNLLNNKAAESDNTAGAMLLKQIGGRINPETIDKITGSKGFLQNLQEKIALGKTGKFDDAQRAGLQKVVSTIGNSAAGTIQDIALHHSSQMANNPGANMSQEDLMNQYLSGLDLDTFATNPSKGQKGQSGQNVGSGASRKTAAPSLGHASITQGGHTFNWNPKTKQYE